MELIQWLKGSQKTLQVNGALVFFFQILLRILIFLFNLTDGTDGWAIQYVDYYRATAGRANGLNVLGLILFCFVFGGVLASMVIFIKSQ